MISLIFTVLLPPLQKLWFLLLDDDDNLRERLRGKKFMEGDFFTAVKKEMLVMVFMSVWKGENLFDEFFLLLDLSSISTRLCMLLVSFGFLENDLNPLEEHEFELSFRKSFSILGLRSIELNLSCCTSILITVTK